MIIEQFNCSSLISFFPPEFINCSKKIHTQISYICLSTFAFKYKKKLELNLPNIIIYSSTVTVLTVLFKKNGINCIETEWNGIKDG